MPLHPALNNTKLLLNRIEIGRVRGQKGENNTGFEADAFQILD